METAKIPQHKHCNVCGLAVKKNKDICSEDCQSKWDVAMRKKKNLQLVMYGSVAFMMVILMLYMFSGG
jgi:predicted nucleic acid-binding Zn ribbon protein